MLPALPFPAFFLICVVLQVWEWREEQAGREAAVCGTQEGKLSSPARSNLLSLRWRQTRFYADTVSAPLTAVWRELFLVLKHTLPASRIDLTLLWQQMLLMPTALESKQASLQGSPSSVYVRQLKQVFWLVIHFHVLWLHFFRIIFFLFEAAAFTS